MSEAAWQVVDEGDQDRGMIVRLKMNVPISDVEPQFTVPAGRLADRPKEEPEEDTVAKPGYEGRQPRGAGTRTVQPYESYSQIRDVLDGLLAKGYYRDYALMMVGMATGLRVSDLVRLNVGDVYDVGSSTFKEVLDVVEVKTGKRTVSGVDEVLITEAVVHGLTTYFENERGWIMSPEEPLFKSLRPDKRGDWRLTENASWRVIKKATAEAGVDIHAGTHTLRKTFLNIANAVGSSSQLSGGSGMVLSDVMVLARHSTITTTLRYTTLMKSRLLSLRRGVSSYLMGRTKVRSLRMEYVWEDADI